MVVVVMGVAGSGKTTTGTLLAGSLGWSFCDGDDLHPPSNVAKMRGGTPLDDDDRRPWLEALRTRIASWLERGENAVLACSALREAHRRVLLVDERRVKLVYLHAAPELLRRRLRNRTGHFLGPGMLASQIATLEEPANALRIDASGTPEAIVAAIRASLESAA